MALRHLRVTDTGIGIPLDKQPSIFEFFSQANGPVTRTWGCTGLGLSITAGLVSKMGGRIWVESEPAQGMTLHCTARLDIQPQRRESIDGGVRETLPEGLANAAGPGARGSAGAPQNLDILLVEDNELNRRLATILLHK